jgi:NAD(P)H-hydrate epimerase
MGSSVLMEIAGRGVAATIHERFPLGEIAILCGPGNNGGDGYVAARWLTHWGRDVRVWGASPKTEDAALNRRLCERMDIPFLSAVDAVAGATIAVDALLGTGQRDAPRGEIQQALTALSQAPQRVAVDIPTGVHPDTGQVLGDAIAYALTVTLGRWKAGLLCAPGCALAGDVYCVDIGLDLAHTVDPSLAHSAAHLIERSDIESWRPHVESTDAKWDRGHVAVLAGGGAAVLAAHGAFRGGAGMVTLLAPKSDWEHFHGLWPEVILAVPETLNPKRHDVVVVGPGLGTQQPNQVLDLWNDYPGGVVADADAITILASKAHCTPGDRPRIITPHVAEAARLLRCERAEVEAHRFAAMTRLNNFGTVVLKGPHTLIGPDILWVNPTGSSRLATAGTGDVLAGLIGGLLATGIPPAHAAAIGVWDHGAAGQRMPEDGTASDLIEAIRPNHTS